MKKLRRIIVIICLLFLTMIVVLMTCNKSGEIYKDETKKERLLTLMVEKEAGSGKYEEFNEKIPSTGYLLNTELSGCENGGKLLWNEDKRKAELDLITSDKCYLYFDRDDIGSICRGKNLSSCFIQNYKKAGTLIYHDGLADYADEENYELEAGDLSYRYSGASDAVNNYVCIDDNNEGNCDEENLYRIIGLFKNNANSYDIKLIKSVIAKYTQVGNGGAQYEWSRYFWNTTNGTNREKNGNMWQYSNLNTINLNTNFYKYIISNSMVKNNILFYKWVTGGLQYSLVYNAKVTYDTEIGNGSGKVTAGKNSCYSSDDSLTKRECKEDDVLYENYIGLMYISDFGYAAYPKAWSSSLMNPGYNNEQIKENNWLSGNDEWSITRYEGGGYSVWNVYAGGNIDYHLAVNSSTYIRPVFYLSTSTKLKNGNGTKDNPYRLM